LRDFAVVNPYPPLWREAKAAAKAAPLLRKARVYRSLARALADRQFVIGTTSGIGRNLDLPACYLPRLGFVLRRRFGFRGGRIAVLFGSEKTGLSNEDLELCHWVLTVPTAPQCPSINLGQAVALVCYELVRTAERPVIALASHPPPPITLGQIERVAQLLEEVFQATGYMATWPRQTLRARLCRILLRWQLKEPDEFLLSGALRWVLKKLK